MPEGKSALMVFRAAGISLQTSHGLLHREIFYGLKRGSDCHRAMAQALQHNQTAPSAWISTACTTAG